jgi:glucokinase
VGYENIRSVGISAPSGNFLTGCIEHSPNLSWKGEIPLAAMMRDRLGLAVAVGNDAYVMALGEATFGSAHGMRDFIVIVLDRGLGSCVFSRGQAYLGNGGYAGEVGHTCIDSEGRLCGCGHLGCLETYCNAEGIVLTAKEMLATTDEPSLMRQAAELSPKLIVEYCEQGDRLAIEVFRKTGETLGMSLANYASVVDPEAIIITGSVSKAGKWIMEPLNEAFEEHVFHNIQNKVKILTSSLDEDERAVLGASVLAWSVKEYSLFK